MSGKLDQSLEEILSARKQTARRGSGRGGRGRGRRAPASGRTTVTTPAGGVQKNRNTKGLAKATAPSGPSAGSGESKIIVSNLPFDVNEGQIKEYFVKSVGPVKRVFITYGPNGVSRGVATIVFNKSNSANDALSQLNGLLVDKKPMKIEVVLDATKAPPPAPVKGLSDRIAQPKKAKEAGATKATTNGEATRGSGRERGRAGRGRNAGRRKPKTADELDAEMVDYFDPSAANGTDGAATANGGQPTVNGGGSLEMDEIS